MRGESDVLKERRGIEVCIGIVGSKGNVFIRYELGRAGISKDLIPSVTIVCDLISSRRVLLFFLL